MSDWLVTAKEDIKDSSSIINPPSIWEWDVFGGGLLVVSTPTNVPLWRRILTKIFLGSTWKKL